jgi:Plavaka transposase
MLSALLPVPKFLHKNKRMRGLLEDRLIHQCLDIVLEPVKKAAQYGTMLPDPVGQMRYCFTPIASYIADTPEAAMVACVGGKTSPVTMAMYKQFGDNFRHEPRTASTTLAQLAVAQSKADP